MKYRKKPVVIEAIQYNGTNLNEVLTLNSDGSRDIQENEDSKGNYLMIPTLEGVMVASIGDFVIQGINKELYPCKPDIFKKTYEAVK